MSVTGLTIPVEPGNPNQELSVTIGDYTVRFKFRWNARDGVPLEDGGPGGSWYFDMYDDDEEIMAAGLKVVLGADIGRGCMHQFFESNVIRAIDTSDQSKEAMLSDFGIRVILIVIDLLNPFGAG